MTPMFSLILPVYNVQDYLERCVRSILAQSFTDYEMILVDDGATDGSGALCDALALQDPRIFVVHKENGGLSSARNAGMEHARGQYIWFIDSDDWIEDGSLKMLSEAVREPVDIVKFNHFRVEQTGKAVYSNAKPGLYSGKRLEILREQAFHTTGKYVLSAWSHLYRAEFLRSTGLKFVSERVIGSEDYLYNLQALLLAERIFVIPAILYDYEMREGSLSRNYKKDLPYRYTELYKRLVNFCAQKGILEKYQGHIGTFYVWHLIHGVFFSNEYLMTQGHSIEEGRKNVCGFLKTDVFREAFRVCNKKHFTPMQKLQLYAMRLRLEPLFYWLYIVRKG